MCVNFTKNRSLDLFGSLEAWKIIATFSLFVGFTKFCWDDFFFFEFRSRCLDLTRFYFFALRRPLAFNPLLAHYLKKEQVCIKCFSFKITHDCGHRLLLHNMNGAKIQNWRYRNLRLKKSQPYQGTDLMFLRLLCEFVDFYGFWRNQISLGELLNSPKYCYAAQCSPL